MSDKYIFVFSILYIIRPTKWAELKETRSNAKQSTLPKALRQRVVSNASDTQREGRNGGVVNASAGFRNTPNGLQATGNIGEDTQDAVARDGDIRHSPVHRNERTQASERNSGRTPISSLKSSLLDLLASQSK